MVFFTHLNYLFFLNILINTDNLIAHFIWNWRFEIFPYFFNLCAIVLYDAQIDD